MSTPTDASPGASCPPSGGCGGCQVCKIGFYLILLGGINWGLIGLGGFLGKKLNVVNMLLGGMPTLEWILYILIGLAAVCKLTKCCKCCKK
jgi:uncharacterized membrane protein YuzA (DUF378 family)|tara:strand:+ start:301 stop:573 length:273 start_codon:yes stop_codon:yes gene_type:complete